MLASNGGRIEITLASGTRIAVAPGPKKYDGSGPIELSYDTFKRLSRAASIFNGKVVDVQPAAVQDARLQDMVARGAGFWVSEHVFVEVEKMESLGPSATDFGVVAAPKMPPSPPPISNPAQWVTLSASTVLEQIPMRVGSGKEAKVVGTLIRTTGGPLYARVARPTEHKLNIREAWAMQGGYSIERELYDKYLTDPATVIKIVRDERVYLTTSEWVQRYGGLIKQWGSERVVIPLAGNFWMVLDKDGEVVK